MIALLVFETMNSQSEGWTDWNEANQQRGLRVKISHASQTQNCTLPPIQSQRKFLGKWDTSFRLGYPGLITSRTNPILETMKCVVNFWELCLHVRCPSMGAHASQHIFPALVTPYHNVPQQGIWSFLRPRKWVVCGSVVVTLCLCSEGHWFKSPRQ